MFIRSDLNPIIKPMVESVWQSRKIYNCGALYIAGKYHLFYRAVGDDGISRIGLATSADGENFSLLPNPILKPSFDHESRGLEDPRTTQLNDEIYLTYAAYDGETARLSLASTKKLRSGQNSVLYSRRLILMIPKALPCLGTRQEQVLARMMTGQKPAHFSLKK